jgi:hypothetical protein
MPGTNGPGSSVAIRRRCDTAGPTGNRRRVDRRRDKRVDKFENMSDEELEAYVNGARGLEH